MVFKQVKTKQCTKCGKVLPVTAEYFQRERKRRDGLRSRCKECCKQDKQKRRGCESVVRNLRQEVGRLADRQVVNKHYIWHRKIIGRCSRCGENRPGVLQFHHRNPEDKKFTVSIPNKRKPETLMDEIDKCDILCANCHYSLHYWERQAIAQIRES